MLRIKKERERKEKEKEEKKKKAKEVKDVKEKEKKEEKLPEEKMDKVFILMCLFKNVGVFGNVVICNKGGLLIVIGP